jgi:hypothetical protein
MCAPGSKNPCWTTQVRTDGSGGDRTLHGVYATQSRRNITVGVTQSDQREAVPSSVRLSSVVIRVEDRTSEVTTTSTWMVVLASAW